jgi:predicted ATPase
VQVSREVRRLAAKWETQTGWPKRLDWIGISGLRGWKGQRFSLEHFPIMAVVGENGAGKSTVLQCAAAVYKSAKPGTKARFASDYFPQTPWDQVVNAEIAYAVREGSQLTISAITKRTDRWRGNLKRRPRHVEYIDLSRVQPVPARVGYTRLATNKWKEIAAAEFARPMLERFNAIMGREYDRARMALTNGDSQRRVPVIDQLGAEYSGFHQGGGETTIAELLQREIPAYSLVLIDEVESSLHPRAQRRLIRDLAERCREGEWQVVLTTHSPYVLEELPPEARAYIMQGSGEARRIVYGVSPNLAMTKMDDIQYADCDLYVEDERAGALLIEVLTAINRDAGQRCRTIPYGAASVGQALGQMVVGEKFPRLSCVFLDGDKGEAPGCLNLPGGDAPEPVVFDALKERGWAQIHERTGRSYAQVVDACNQAMTQADHHVWVDQAASRLFLGGETLWQVMCSEWANKCLPREEGQKVVQPIEDELLKLGNRPVQPRRVIPVPEEAEEPKPEPMPEPAPSEPEQLF